MMRRIYLVFLASLQLSRARQPGFSIHDDLLAHPQFEVIFSDSYILEPDALALLESKRTRSATYAPDVSQTDLANLVRESAAADATAHSANSDSSDDEREITETYEVISSPNSRYLCSIPAVAQAPELNQTATELAKAEEAREISRASARGWELMSGLSGRCLYFVSGWWSYSFCYGKEIVQFHAAPNSAGGIPVKDPGSHEYVLGTTTPPKGRKGDVAPKGVGQADTKGVSPPNADLQIKGDQRYLVQRLDGGTICDLTGRPRTIEIQYHCNPGTSDDRIGWIKEVTTCAYLMVVQTPRLCADVAFLPPKETRAHPISCRAIISSDEEADAWRWRKSIEAKEKMGVTGAQKAKIGKDAAREQQFTGMTIGGVVVGGKRVLGSKEGEAPVELALPRGIAASRQSGDTWAALGKYLSNQRKKVGEGASVVDTLTAEDLEQLGVDKETVEAVKKELEKLGDNDIWQIAVEVIPPGGEAAAGQGGEKEQTRQTAGHGQGQTQKGNGNGKKPRTRDAKPGGGKNGQGGEGEEEEGSQEIFFKDEL